MNPHQIGKEFEREAYHFLKPLYEKVIWKSQESFHSHYDFACYSNGKEYLIDAKTSPSLCIQIHPEVSLFITKINGKIKIIPPKKIKLKFGYSLIIDIPHNINKRLKIEKIERELNTLTELVVKILRERYSDE